MKAPKVLATFSAFFSFSRFTSVFLSFLIQIAELKRGAEIIVCTPGRMIDMLTANNGKKIVLLARVFLTQLRLCCITFYEMLIIERTL